MRNKIVLLVVNVLVTFGLFAQNEFVINWQKPHEIAGSEFVWFESASFQTQNSSVPSFCSEVFSENPGEVVLKNEVYAPLSVEEMAVMNQHNTRFSATPELLQHAKNENGYSLIKFCVVPIRESPSTHILEKLISFDVEVIPDFSTNSTSYKTESTTDTNALAGGYWYKLGVTQTGVYKITPSFLSDCGINVSGLPSSSLRVLGNGKGVLSERNDDHPNPGLQEVAIYVNDGGDGFFDGNDYALFYAKGPHRWDFNEASNSYAHTHNIYSDVSYYFISVDNGNGLRVSPTNYPVGNPNYLVESFDDFQFVEEDKYNLVASGRKWFGNLYDFTLSYRYTMQFADVLKTDTAFLRTRAVARSVTSGTKMKYIIDGTEVTSLNFTAVSTSSTADYVVERSGRAAFFPKGNTIEVNTIFDNAVNSSATAWMDYVAIELRRKLNFSGSDIIFRDRRAFRNGGLAQYKLTSVPAKVQIWDVTNHNVVREVTPTIVGTEATFIAPSDTLRTFVALNGSAFPYPSKVGHVPNQHLVGMRDMDMVIVSHADFLSQAEELAEMHRLEDGLTVAVVTPQEIYNEFSSGMQDITAIKLYLRNLYKKSTSKPVRFLLFMGDASYDYKNRVANMHNFVPVYESEDSYSLSGSTCTDDFFGYLDDGEGKNMLLEDLDIAIGRMPVKTVAEAKSSVEKVKHYRHSADVFGDWRNRAMLIADDVDDDWEKNFLSHTDILAQEIDTTTANLNIQKVYIDSYEQETKAGSQRYPGARQDIYRKVQKGNLVTTYLGHGGEVGWAKERILQLADINGWDNLDNMPMFLTVTCEFTRMDDPARVSGGEQLFLNPKGGAISLISTLRPVYAKESTYNINRQLFENLFVQQNGEYLTMGEVIQVTKNNNSSSDRLRFALIGDPALYLAIPKNVVQTDSINGVAAGAFSDTLKALSKVRISGHIEDRNGSLMSGFNGIVNPTVFDKKAPKSTLKNDGAGPVMNYESQENVIFRGISSVENGRFTFEFVVPLDINFVVGPGKISYYATNEITDAAGYNTDVQIGALNITAALDDKGPQVRVFINDTNFLAGGLTDADPESIALVSDTSGINTVGNGIGHDLIGILDGNTNSPYILNDYFTADKDSYQSGTIKFPFFGLEPGTHRLLIRAWDVNNNPGEGEITFVVDNSHELALKRVLNYPNPFHNETRFQFEHNRAGEPLEVDVQIFNQNGQMVKRIIQNVTSQGNRVNEITWDGTGDSGAILTTGVYMYRVIVRSTEDGATTSDYSKLVFVN